MVKGTDRADEPRCNGCRRFTAEDELCASCNCCPDCCTCAVAEDDSEVDCLRAEVAALHAMLDELIRAADHTVVETRPYAGLGHSKVIGPFPEVLARAKRFVATLKSADGPR